MNLALQLAQATTHSFSLGSAPFSGIAPRVLPREFAIWTLIFAAEVAIIRRAFQPRVGFFVSSNFTPKLAPMSFTFVAKSVSRDSATRPRLRLPRPEELGSNYGCPARDGDIPPYLAIVWI